MCIIIKGKTENIKDEVLKRAYENNKNGFGLFYFNNEKNKIIADKIYPKNLDDVKKLFSKHKNKTEYIALHFRYATNGEKNKFNSHPFKVVENENIKMFLMHNSPTLPCVFKSKKYSDTFFFVKQFLKPIIENDYKLIGRKDFKNTLRKIINVETNSRILLIDTFTKKFHKIGDWLFNKEFQLHVSNDYGLKKSYWSLNTWSNDDDDFGTLPFYNSRHNVSSTITKHLNNTKKISVNDDSKFNGYKDVEQKSINETTNTMSDILFNFETGSVGEIIEILNEYPVLSARLIKESFNNNQLDDNDLEKIAVDETKKANEV